MFHRYIISILFKEGAFIIIDEEERLIMAIYDPDQDIIDMEPGKYLDDLRVKMKKSIHNGP